MMLIDRLSVAGQPGDFTPGIYINRHYMIVEIPTTRWTYAGRIFCHRRGIGIYCYSLGHDRIWGFIKNGVGRWLFVDEEERYD